MKQKDLERIITHLDSCYELGEDCIHPDTNKIVSDGEYDALRRELFKLDPNSSIFNTPTASTVQTVKKVIHDPPMTSISKASHEDKDIQESQLFKWINDCIEPFDNSKSKNYVLDSKKIDGIIKKERVYNGKVVSYPSNFFYQSYKLDGVACALYYKNGKLISAGLRPRNGIDGEDITAQIKFVSGIPTDLKIPVTCSIRGEIICKKSDFDKVQSDFAASGEKLRANPRNHAAGGIRQFKTPSKVAQMRLTFVGYSIEGLVNPPYQTEIERAIWCNKELGVSFIQIREFNFYDLEIMESNVDKLDYEVDGVVIGVNCLEDQEQLGRHGDSKIGNPKGKIAWKFAEEKAKPIIKSIEWNTGRTGNIKPVAIFDSVDLAGTKVSRATLHNLGFMYRNNIGVGTQIVVLKAGKIIPKVIGVESNCKNYNSIIDIFDAPQKCPSCGNKVSISSGKDDTYELFCNNSNCISQNINSLCHYLDTFGVLGLGDSKVSSLVEGGVVKNPVDFYKLDKNSIVSCGLSERQALLILGGIHLVPSPEKLEDSDLEKEINKAKLVKKKIPLWRLFACFGIESAGKSTGKSLVDHFGTFDKIRKASKEELEKVSDVGEKTASVIFEFLNQNRLLIDDLLNYVEPELPKFGILSGKSFVFTGGFPDGKSKWEKEVESLGGKCGSSVSKSTSYVVVGTDAGSKEKKATDLGIIKLSLDDLKKLLRN